VKKHSQGFFTFPLYLASWRPFDSAQDMLGEKKSLLKTSFLCVLSAPAVTLILRYFRYNMRVLHGAGWMDQQHRRQHRSLEQIEQRVVSIQHAGDPLADAYN
jgi:hypothetical protein